jgi:hypothetical protein
VVQPIELIPLVCIQCSTPIPAESNEMAWVCANCGQGQYLDPTQGLIALQVYYAASIPANTAGKPYWVVDGQVNMRRQVYHSAGKSAQESEAFWRQPRRFYIPAFSAPLDALLSQASSLLLQPPNIQAGAPVRFAPVTLAMEDIRSTAEFVVMAVEAGRKDMVKDIQFDLRLSTPALWILP